MRRQHHYGFAYQGPGLVDHVVNKKAEVARVSLPLDAMCLASGIAHCVRSRHYINVVIVIKHLAPKWLTMNGPAQCTVGIGIGCWASNDQGEAPDVIMACCDDVPPLETLAAVSIICEHLADLEARAINIVDLQPQAERPYGLGHNAFDGLFTTATLLTFAPQACPWQTHGVTYCRTNHQNIYVAGHKEEGTITTAFDMTVLDELDCFHLVMDTVDGVPRAESAGAALEPRLQYEPVEHKRYIDKNGQDLPGLCDRQWR